MSIQNDKPAAVVVNDNTTQLGILSGMLAKAGIDGWRFCRLLRSPEMV